MNRKITLILPLIVLGFIFNAKAQCPPNIDFELGSMAYWKMYTGSCCTAGVPSVPTLGAVAGRHDLTTGPGIDPYGGFPVVAPGGGAYSLKLGNDINGAQAERARYHVAIPTGGIYSLIYRYAVVLNDPGHSTNDQPRMVVDAIDSNTGSAVPCAQYLYVVSSTIPGFLTSSVTGYGSPVRYKTWTMGNMKFPGMGGHTAIVDFTTADCAPTGHFGYGYLDMTCGLFANQILGCASGTTVLAGPDGYAAYNWVDSATYGTSVGGSQVVVITAPTVTTTYAVLLTPYTGYGCPDTLYTRVIPSTLTVNASNDTSICSGSGVGITAGATSASMPITYSWTPSAGLSCATCASPTATPTITTSYSVTAIDAAGCIGRDVVNITVYPTPGAIMGPLTVCPGESITLTNSASGVTWSTTPTSIATINPTSGLLTGIASGTVTVTATTGGSGTFCTVTRGVTVNPLPSPITGPSRVCVGSTITLSDATSGGVWSAPGYGAIATIGSASGVVTGVASGVALITYSVASTGCKVVKSVTVDAAPSLISGFSSVCMGATITLFGTPTGGTWSSGSSTLSVNSSSGDVTGVAVGTGTVTYTLSTGCYLTKTITVNALPAAITGPTRVCVGATISLTDTDPGGTWSSSGAAAGVDAVGVVTGASSGVATISYTTTGGCAATYPVTVDPIPSPIIPTPATVCEDGTSLVSDIDPGTWSVTGGTGTATIHPTSGVITGISAGTATITLTSPFGCIRTAPLTVIAKPNPITGTLSLCVGTSVVVSSTSIPGSFSTSGPVCGITTTGIITGLSVGTQTITYTHTPTGCKRTVVVTVNSTPGPIAGSLSICQCATTTVFNSVSGGTWSITPTTVATITPTGSITALCTGASTVATATITYSLGAGCSSSAVLTVNPLPGPITGTPSLVICQGSNTTLGSSPSGGTWSTSSSSITLNSTTGAVVGNVAGTASVTYTTAAGCTRTGVVTINPIPAAITPASPAICQGQTIDLDCSTVGGTWSSLSPPAMGSIVPATGVFTGLSTGTVTIRYQLSATLCARTTVVTINALPSLYTMTPGTANICPGTTTAPPCLSGSAVGISYRLMNGSTPVGAPVAGTGAGICFPPVTAAGTYTIVGTVTATGCTRTMSGSMIVTVNPPATIAGASAVCALNSTTLVGSPAGVGSSWVSSNPTAVSVSSTGVATGGPTSGLCATITYTSPSAFGSCVATHTVCVTPSPGAIIVPSGVCQMSSITLGNSVSGGVWSSSSSCITIGSLTGVVTGVSSPCTAPVTYSLGSGCQVTGSVNVTPQPNPISATSGGVICVGQSLTVSSTTPGGIWVVDPSSTSMITVSGSGTVTGIGGGIATISYVASGGSGCSITRTITVNALSAPITTVSGIMRVCQGSTLKLDNLTPGGTWSVSPSAVASIVSSTGLLTGTVVVGSTTSSIANVTYTLPTGCSISAPVTVNPLPSPILGSNNVCQGAVSTVSVTATPGGTWTSSNPLIASIGSTTGVITGGPGFGAGIIITYTLPTTCSRTMNITVNPAPAAIVGPTGICVGNTVTFINPTPGGVWGSSTPSVATISPTTGIATGSSGGTTNISYTWSGCSAITVLTVIPTPPAIVGPPSICQDSCQLYTNASVGGAWTSNLPSVVSITSGGMACGHATGTAIISYGVGACYVVKSVAVNPVFPITGPTQVCQDQDILLSNIAVGGMWISLNPSVATVSASGIVHGNAPGVATIRYILLGGCPASYTITVNPIPSPILGTLSGCVGDIVLLTNTSTWGPGIWNSVNPSVATIDAGGLVTAVAPGTSTITYGYTSTGCITSKVFTVNPLVPAINGPGSVCMGSSSIPFTNPVSGGVWSESSGGTVATISSTGHVTPVALGTTTLTYMLGTGCISTKTINVISSVPAITGDSMVCALNSILLSNTSLGGSWTSGTPSVATVDPTGLVIGIAAGTTSITYSLGGGCETNKTVTVNPLPGAITPSTPNICVGSSVTLSSTSPGGTWLSTIPAIATVDASGNVTGVSAGTAIVSYTLPTGCATSVAVNVSVGPPAISGPNTFCVGAAVTYFNPSIGGTWSSSNPAVGSIDPIFGVLSGTAPGATVVIYTDPGYVCPATMPVTVNPVPGVIAAPAEICQGLSATLTNPVPGGTWTSSDPTTATIHPSTGVLNGVITGLPTSVPVVIDYSLGAGPGCTVNAVLTVNPLPANIFGADSVCAGQAIALFSGTPGGTWSSTVPTVGTIDLTGTLSGIAGGITTVSYTNTYGCAATHPVTVNTSPAPITGAPNVCLGGNAVLTNTVPGGTWTSNNPTTISVGASSGVLFGHTLGSATITYTMMPGSCAATFNVSVSPLPSVFTVTGGGNHCDGDAGVHVYLSGSTVGVNYMLYRGATAVGAFPGTGSILDFGLHTLAGSYTVKGTSSTTFCTVNMSGSATIGVIPSVTPSVVLNATPNDTVCAGTTVTLTPVATNGGLGPVYRWSVNGIPVAVAGSYGFVPADGDVVSVEMTSNAVCPSPATATRSLPISVRPFGMPTANVVMTPNDTVCRGTIVTANAVTTYAGPSPSYTWYKNGTIVSYSGSTYSFPALNGDEMFVVLTSNDPCRLANVDSSARVVETVEEPILPVVVINANPGTTISKGQTSTLTAMVTKATNPTYQWYINGMPVAGATNVSFTSTSYSYPEVDSFSVAVTSHDVCEVTTHEWVYVRVVTTGVGQMSAGSDITVVPNPNNGRFTVKGMLASATDEEVILEVTNVLGQSVYKENFVAKNGKLNHEVTLSKSLANGMYMLTVRSGADNKVFHIVVEQ